MTQNKTEILITANNQTEQAFRSIKSQFSDLTRNIDGISGKFQGLTGIFAAFGATLSVGAFASWVKGAIDAADEMGKMAQKVGVTVESLSALTYAGSLADVSTEQLSVGLKQLSKNMLAAAEGSKAQVAAFKALGVETRNTDGTLRSTDDVFSDIADRFSELDDGALKTAISMKIFGKSGGELIPLLNEGKEGLQEMKDEAERLGLVMSEDTAKAAENFNDNLTRLKASSQGLALSLAEGLLPALNTFTDQLNKSAQTKGWRSLYEFSKAFLPDPSSQTFPGDEGPSASKGQPATNIAKHFSSISVDPAGYGTGTFDSAVLGAPGSGMIDFATAGRSSAIGESEGKSKVKVALERYLREFETNSSKIKTVKSKADEQKRQLAELQRELAKADDPGGLYEWYETYQAGQDIANFQPKLKAPEIKTISPSLGVLDTGIKKPSFDLGFQDVAFQSLEQQEEAVLATNDELDKLAQRYDELFGIRVPSALDGATAAWAEYSKMSQDSTLQAFDAVTFSIRATEDTLLEFVMTGKASFEDLAKSIIASFARIQIQKLLGGLGDGLSGLLGSFSGMFGGGGTIIDGVSTMDWLQPRAAGGPVFGGTSYFVGEKGPEIFTPGSPGFITPNSALTGSSSLTVNVLVNVDGNKRLVADLQDEIESTVNKVIRRHS